MSRSCLCGLLFLVACDVTDADVDTSLAGSGVAVDRGLAGLSPDEQAQMCDYLNKAYGPPRTITCGDGGWWVTIERLPSCAFQRVPASCVATVADAERCIEAITSEWCSTYTPECEAMFDCVTIGE